MADSALPDDLKAEFTNLSEWAAHPPEEVPADRVRIR